MYEEYWAIVRHVGTLPTTDEYYRTRNKRLSLPKGPERSRLYEKEQELWATFKAGQKDREEGHRKARKLKREIINGIKTEDEAKAALKEFFAIDERLWPDEMARQMSEMRDYDDHEWADELMVAALVHHGYALAMLHYLDMEKWYA